MGYNQENFRRIRAEYETKAMKAEEAADARREELKKQQAKAGTFAVTFDGCDENPEVEALLKARQDAKKAKNFAEADAIRARVTEMGYAIEDTATGPKVRKA